MATAYLLHRANGQELLRIVAVEGAKWRLYSPSTRGFDFIADFGSPTDAATAAALHKTGNSQWDAMPHQNEAAADELRRLGADLLENWKKVELNTGGSGRSVGNG